MPSVKECPAPDASGPRQGVYELPSQTLGHVFREVEPLLLSIATRLCRNASDATDLVQDTFERALRFEGHEPLRNPRSWLVTILRNLFFDRCRVRARRRAVESLQGHDSLHGTEPWEEPQPAWSWITLADVRAALKEIKPDCRRAFEMRIFERRSYEEIAVSLRIKPVTVGTRLNRARRQLRAVLSAVALPRTAM